MKKITAIILSLLMLVSILSVGIIPASAATAYAKTYEAAADGDTLLDVTFGETTGVYVPGVFAHAEGADGKTLITTAVPGADKTSIVFTKPESADAKGKRYFYGGKFDGLTIGADKKYTIEFKANCTAQNFGAYFNFADDLATADANYNPLLGYYGTPQGWNSKANETVSYGAGGKAAGQYVSDGNAYVTDVAYISTPDADGFVTIAIEIDGFSFSIFKNGVFFDKAYIADYCEYLNLGLSFYLYNAGSLTIKDCKVLKGNKNLSAASFTYPTTERFAAPTTGTATLNQAAYDKAYLGQKLTDVIFGKTTGDFVSSVYFNAGAACEIDVSNDGKTVHLKKGATKGQTWYGGSIGDLRITDKTKYTFVYKIKANSGNAGPYFNFNEAYPTSRANIGIYGSFTHATPASAGFVIQKGSGKVVNAVFPGSETNYVKFLDTTTNTDIKAPLLDANGYLDLVTEFDGYTFNAYYKTADGSYFKCGSYTPTESEIRHGGMDVGFSAYIYNVNAEAEFSDVALYKGLLSDYLQPSPPTGDNAVYYAGAAAIALVAVFGTAWVARRRVSAK